MFSFGGIDAATFLRDYWQKKPLLIRQAFPDFVSPVSPDELAGLAMEEGIESRIVLEQDKGKPWQVKHGPFDEKAFRKLPKTHWTLLVQGLDYWAPEVSDLLEHFRFIPNWRIDDIMASYAPEHGSVGPHFDYYDVFLLQAHGRRNWKIGPHCNGEEARVAGTPLRILENFETLEEWVLEPGDMLYLPPQIAHYGIALEDCITLSIGFRSPTHQELLSSWADSMGDRFHREIHLDDPDLTLQDNPGEIQGKVIDQVNAILRALVDDRDALSEWFGRYVTQPKFDGIVTPPDRPLKPAAFRKALEKSGGLRRNEGSRLSYSALSSGSLLYADGDCFSLASEAELRLVKQLCLHNEIDVDSIQELLKETACIELLTHLFNQGSLYLADDA